MANPALLLLFIFSWASVSYLTGVESITFIVKNNCPYTIWPANLSGSRSLALYTTDFELASGANISIDAPTPWSGGFWARTGCQYDSTGSFRCSTGECASGQIPCNGAGGNSPATLAEFTLAGHQGKDFYDISLVDGFNLPMSVAPQGGSCPTTSCAADLNRGCPDALAVMNGSEKIGCKSACLALNEPQYCCSGDHNTPQTCPPTDYSKYFKSQCPQAYSYAFDDSSSTFTCPTGGNYLITFCP